MDDAIEDGVGQCGIADDLVPAFDRDLAGDDERAAIVAVVDDLQQIAALLGGQRLGSPVVEDQQVDARELAHQASIAAIAARQRQGSEQPRAALVEDRQIFAACLVAEGAGEPRFADPAGAGDQAVAVLADPVATGEPQEHGTIEAAGRLVVDVFDRGGVPQFGGPRAGLEAPLLSQRGLLVDQQTQPFGVVKALALGVGRQIAEALGHALEAKLVQTVECRVVQQGLSPQWK